jgi:hypothetical protein
MLGKDPRWPTAARACGLICGLMALALLGCRDEPSVASKSAAAFREAQKRGETFAGEGHAHGGHGAMAPGGAPAAEAPHAAHGEEHPAGHDHGAMEAPAAGAGHEGHGGHAPTRSGGAEHGGHAAAEHGRRPAPGGHEGHAAMEHAGHGTTAPQAPAAGTQPPAAGHEGHAGHAPAAGATPSAPAPVAVPSEQPARTLRPDALDAPAATSVLDAQRSAEMAQEMAGGHGSATYRHVDAGRGPEAHEGSEPQTPGAGAQHHDHGPAETVYVCPMHPEVTSKTPGTCPKCGMTLVERRKG